MAFERLLRLGQPAMAVVDQDGGYLGVVTPEGMQRRWREGERGSLANYAQKTDLALDCASSLDAARRQMLASQTWVAPVYCGGQFAGLLNLGTIGRILALRRNGQDSGQLGLGAAIDA
jgi:hypothetical protein